MIEQHTTFNGQSIKVTPETAQSLNEVQSLLTKRDTVLINMNWGTFYVTDSHCVDYNFRATPERTISLLENKYNGLKNLTYITFDWLNEPDKALLDKLSEKYEYSIDSIRLPPSTLLYKIEFKR